MALLEIDSGLLIPKEELRFTTGPSSGPGGQNVNRVHTRVTLSFDVAGSPSLSGEQRQRIAELLSTRMTKDGLLRVTSQRHRTQAANRKAATERFVELIAEALTESPERRQTRVPKAARRKRRAAKRRRSQVKRDRKAPPLTED